MTYYSIRWWLFLVLFVVCGYYLLRFFGKLWNTNMLSLVTGSIKTGCKGWLFVFMAVIFYFVFIFGLFVFLETPVQILQMKNHHAGGLLGYRDGWAARVFDPSRSEYIAYTHLTPPPAADKFTEAFKTVLLYKSRPHSKTYSEYYQDTAILSLPSQLITLLVTMIGLFVLYLIFYLMIKSGSGHRIEPITMKHLSSQAARFQDLTGMTVVKALVIALSVYVFVCCSGIVAVKMLINHYKGLYAAHQNALRTTLLKKVSTDQTIRGTVIRRHYEEKSYKDISRVPGRTGRWKSSRVPVFTAEFRDLMSVPVYLNVTIPPDHFKEGNDMLSAFFPDEREIVPNRTPELRFIVNPDYTISPKRDKNESGRE